LDSIYLSSSQVTPQPSLFLPANHSFDATLAPSNSIKPLLTIVISAKNFLSGLPTKHRRSLHKPLPTTRKNPVFRTNFSPGREAIHKKIFFFKKTEGMNLTFQDRKRGDWYQKNKNILFQKVG
jgi:hypothetical protein